jgi:hypothetical protein
MLIPLPAENITNNSKLEMSWQQYEEKIVEHYGVILDGWPVSQFNPGQMSTHLLQIVLNALEDGTCGWRTLERQDLQDRQVERKAKMASGELNATMRKRRSDAGKARGTYSKRRRAEVGSNEISEENNDGEVVESHMRGSGRRQPVSSESIIDSD